MYVGEEVIETLHAAKIACDSNPDCLGIYDGRCNGKHFMLCMKSSYLYKSHESSCVYIKKDTQRNIFHCSHINKA